MVFLNRYQGVNPEDDRVHMGVENKYHMWCYNLSNNMGASFSVNGQQSAFQKANINYIFFTYYVVVVFKKKLNFLFKTVDSTKAIFR